MAAFVQRKAQCLARADASRKGGLDERAAAVVQLLNGRSRFCTTSSCSGRLVLAQGGAAVTQSCGIQKTNCTWLLVTHETCAKDDVMTALEKATGDVVLKFEPFVLHVLCQELQDAQLLHSVAVNSGFRNSGITVGRGGKIMMAVRSTHCLEVPLSHKGKLMVSEEYMEFLIDVANQKMEENTRRIGRFYKCLELALEAPTSADTSPEETGKNHAVYTRRRKRKTIQEQEAHTSPKDHSEEPGPADDAETNLGPLQSSTCKYRWPSQTTPSLMSVSRRAVRAMELLASGAPETEKASCNRRLQPWKSNSGVHSRERSTDKQQDS